MMMNNRLFARLNGRPWQNLCLLAICAADLVLRLAADCAVLFGEGTLSVIPSHAGTLAAVVFVLLAGPLVRAAVLLCLLYTRRLGWAAAFLLPPQLLVRGVITLFESGGFGAVFFVALFFAFYFYCLLSAANRRYCWPSMYKEYEPDAAAPGHAAGDRFAALSSRLNRYEGMRQNASLDVLVGPSPAELMPRPAVRDWDGTRQEDDGESDYDYEDDFEDDYEGCYDPEIDGNPEPPDWRGDAPVPPGENDLYQRFKRDGGAEEARFTALAFPEKLDDFDGLSLLRDCGAFDFLKRSSRVQRMFKRACAEALSDLRGYEKPPRKGLGSADDLLHKNKLRVLVSMEENAYPPKYKISAEFFINC